MDGSNEKPRDMNELYQLVLKDFKRLQALFGQQPNNAVALGRALSGVRTQLVALRSHVSTRELPDQSKRRSQPSSSDVGKSPPPQGPVKPSSKRPTDKDVERYIDATEKTHRRTPPLGQNSIIVKKLDDVPADTIRQMCDAALVHVDQAGKLIKQSNFSKDEFRRALSRLEKVLDQIDSPPANNRDSKSKEDRDGNYRQH